MEVEERERERTTTHKVPHTCTPEHARYIYWKGETKFGRDYIAHRTSQTNYGCSWGATPVWDPYTLGLSRPRGDKKPSILDGKANRLWGQVLSSPPAAVGSLRRRPKYFPLKLFDVNTNCSRPVDSKCHCLLKSRSGATALVIPYFPRKRFRGEIL